MDAGHGGKRRPVILTLPAQPPLASIPMVRGNGHHSNPLPLLRGSRTLLQASSPLSLQESQSFPLNSPQMIDSSSDSDYQIYGECTGDETLHPGGIAELAYRRLTPSPAPCLEEAFLRKSQESRHSQEMIDRIILLETGQGDLRSYWSDDSDDEQAPTPMEAHNNLFTRRHKYSVSSTNAPSSRLRESFRTLRRGKSQSDFKDTVSSPTSSAATDSESVTLAAANAAIKRKLKKRPPLPRLPVHHSPVTPTTSNFFLLKQPAWS